MNAAKRLEVHTHTYISGPIALRLSKVTHSHEGGDVPHQHEDMGPATYTIDKDRWLAATGLVGGSRKRFTAKPTGPQFDRVELEGWQKSFRIVSSGQQHGTGTGGGLATAARMVSQFGMTID